MLGMREAVVFFCVFVAGTAGARQKFTVQPFYSVRGTMIGLIGLGTPTTPGETTMPTAMELNPTTPDFFVVPTNCKTKGCTQNRKGYATDKSSTFSDNGRKVPFATAFGGTKSSGFVGKDALTALAIPGRAPPEIPLPIVDEPQGALVSSPATGVMGQGFLPADSKQPGTFLQGMVKNLDLPVFEVFLQSYTYSKAKDISTYGNVTYGNDNPDYCQGNHFFLKTDYPREWALKMDAAKIGLTPLKGGKALFYHGSPRIHAPLDVVAAIRQRIHAKYDFNLKEYYVDCDKKKQLPRLYLTFHKKLFTYYPREYLVQLENTNKCVLVIAGPSPRYKGADWVLGDPVYREHCLYFDFAGPRIGFTKQKGK